MKAMRAYQSSIMRILPVRSVVNFPADQIKEEQPEDKIEAGKPDEGKNDITVIDHRAVPLAGPEETVDEPRLASQFGGHPAQRVRDIGERKSQHERPKQPD